MWTYITGKLTAQQGLKQLQRLAKQRQLEAQLRLAKQQQLGAQLHLANQQCLAEEQQLEAHQLGAQSDDWNGHMAEVRPEKRVDPGQFSTGDHSCLECGQSFTNLELFNNHLQEHSKLVKHFVEKSSLEQHLPNESMEARAG